MSSVSVGSKENRKKIFGGSWGVFLERLSLILFYFCLVMSHIVSCEKAEDESTL
jgi:hypothetical protein